MKTNSVLLIQNDSVINYGATVLVVDLATLSPLGKVLFKEWQATEHPALARALGEVCGVPLCEVLPITKPAKREALTTKPVATPSTSTKRRRSAGERSFQRWSAADDTTMLDLYTKGISNGEIARALGRSRQSVATRIWSMNKNNA
jgi:hypothetical protein